MKGKKCHQCHNVCKKEEQRKSGHSFGRGAKKRTLWKTGQGVSQFAYNYAHGGKACFLLKIFECTAGCKKFALRKKQELWFTSSSNDQIRYRMLSLKEWSHEMDLSFDDIYG